MAQGESRRQFLQTVAGAAALSITTNSTSFGNTRILQVIANVPAPGGHDRLEPDWYRAKVKQVQAKMKERNLNALVLLNSHNVIYTVGYFHLPTERPLAVLIPQSGEPALFIPELESDQVKLWWVTDYEAYFDYPGPVNRVRWIFERINARGLGGGRIGIEECTPSRKQQIQLGVPKATLVDSADLIEEMRWIKDEQELALMRRATYFADYTVKAGREYVQNNGSVTEDQILKAAADAVADIQNAFIASFFVSVVAAIVGYFMLVRGLTFAGHAFSHVGFAGAAGAVWLGINPIYGLLAFTIAAAIGIGSLGRELRERDITIGIMFTLALAFGVLFLFLYTGYAEEAYSILFGTILGISTVNVAITAFFSLLTIGTVLSVFRPLLFSSFDPEVAEARGVPTQKLAIAFLILAAITVSVSVQVVGVLLIFTLLVGPAATAMRLVKGPYKAIGLAIILGLLYSWISIFLAAETNLPVSFFIATLSFGVYLPVRLLAKRNT